VGSVRSIRGYMPRIQSHTPYLYSTHEANAKRIRRTEENNGWERPKPDWAGIEFDYCCCHASFALNKAGFETIMVNCNPRRCRPI
jgi:carbamoyl-phosphate synthase large subunit